MRSLVMFLVSHEDDTDVLQAFAQDTAHLYAPPYVGVIDYSVRVDVPECFVLEGSQAAKDTVDEILDLLKPDPWYRHTHVSARDDSPAMLVSSSDDGLTLTLVNEDGYTWTDSAKDWRPID